MLFAIASLAGTLASCDTNKHVHEETDWIVDVEATCTTAGSKHVSCKLCEEVVKTEEIPALGHDMDTKWTCKADTEEIEIGGKKATLYYGTGSHFHECKRAKCEYKEDEADCTLASDWEIETDKTCTEDGVKFKRCTICEGKIAEAVIKKSHAVAEDAEWSYDDNGHWFDCDDCEVKVGQASHESDKGCEICGYAAADIVASLKTASGIVYYSSFADALEAMGDEGGWTLKLFKDVVLTDTWELKGTNCVINGNGKKISDKSINLDPAADVKFNGVTFSVPGHQDNRVAKSSDLPVPSNVYGIMFYGHVEFNSCSFIETAWDNIQITPAAGPNGEHSYIKVDSCTFANPENVKSERYLHIQETEKKDGSIKTEIIITNNNFGTKTRCTNSIIDIDYVDYENDLVAFGNTFVDDEEDLTGYAIYVCKTSEVYMSDEDAYTFFTKVEPTEEDKTEETPKGEEAKDGEEAGK